MQVSRSIVELLDIHEKLALRLTCTSTMDWVTTKDFIKKFKVKITSNEDLISWITRCELFSSEDICDICNSFCFQQDLIEYDQSLLTEFFSSFHAQIDTLELKYCSAKDDAFWKILSHLDNLTSLIIQEMDVSNCEDEDFQDKASFRIELDHLRTFSVEQLVFCNPGDLRAWEKIVILLDIGSTHVVTIPKPRYKGNDSWVTWPQVKALQWVLIAEPMLHYLNGCPKGHKILLNVIHLVPIHFGRLAERCMAMNEAGCDIYFNNVHSNHVKYVFLLAGNEHEEDFLGRIVSIREKIDDRRPLRRWTALEELSIKTSRCDVRNSYEGGDLVFPQLKKIEIDFDSVSKDDPGFVALYRVINLLLKVKRTSVEEVVLKWGQHLHDTPLSVVNFREIKDNFSSLRSFVVISDGVVKRIV